MSKIYSKINKIKTALSELDIKKSGKNTYTNITYYELKDFLPSLVKLMQNEGITSIVSFDKEYGSLQLIDCETGEIVESKSPLVIADIKGANAVQNLGAAQTYLRRYLYMNMFDIVEGEAHDSLLGKPDKVLKKESTKNQDANETNLNVLDEWITIAAEKEGQSVKDLYGSLLKKHGVEKVADLNNNKLESIIEALQKRYGGEG